MKKIVLKRLFKIFFTLLGGLLGYAFIHWLTDLSDYPFRLNPFKKEYIALCGALTGAGILYFTSNKFIGRLILWISRAQEALHRASSKEMIMGSIGVIFGLIVANLINITVVRVPYSGILLALMCNFLFAYLGIIFFTKNKNLMEDLIKINSVKTDKLECKSKVVDTSAIIDGRIVDVCKLGFIEGTLIIPEFVLKELRHIADSHDPEKRTRGRRGLDVLNIMQKESNIKVEILEDKMEIDKNEEVDIKLLKLARELGAKVITTDYNLNRIAEFQGIRVLNVNELASAIKPVTLPGEEMIIKVIKDGKELGQGVGYLDDGTMVVIDEGKRHIGETIGVKVTHVLQTGTGRMIFARTKYNIEDVV